MNYWLMKTEPETFGWDNLVKDKKATWDGVRNYAARNHMKAMTKGDRVFIYHSVTGKEIVGIAEVIKESFQDPTTDDNRWVAVEVSPVEPLKRPVSLQEVKENDSLQDMFLVTHSRLSVQPVTKEQFNTILKLSKK